MTGSPQSDTVIIALAIIQLIGVIVAAIFAYLGKQQASTTHDLVNSKMTELLDITAQSSKAEGVAEGVAAVGKIKPLSKDKT